ncbi:hypothetical protein HYALB_00006491 [Hymenoscyphus albidus]|uniref:BRCT domain-containing protein n=1 Tax=Hymenoscyphus albidus TaxID=595503 RepID=A0A9N9LHZ1_9HELO|nr:hypothetical protein HYALB_00006491 [Hymenoscyphus albidus]
MDTNSSKTSIPLNGASDNPKPLAGVYICCTAVAEETRTKIAEYSEQMGARHRYDLTQEVTHLIVGGHNTDKYRFVARNRPDVKPMTVEWIEKLRDIWMKDEEIDMEFLEKQHTLPTFHGLKFSMTGCDNPDDRSEIAEQVRSNGAIYEGDLTKHITHLISFRTDGAKYNAAKSWGITVVSVEWLRDSLERGMILDESRYDPLLPPEERGNAWDKSKPKRISLGKRARDESFGGSEGAKRKLRRTASTKLNSQSEKMWGDIVGRGGLTEVARSGVWEPQVSAQNIQKQPELKQEDVREGIFSGCRFYFHGFIGKRVEVLCNHLLPQGAEVAVSLEQLHLTSSANPPQRLFMIVPHDLPVSQHPALPESQLLIETITVFWVERCLHYKKFVDPSEHVIGRPFPVFPIQGFAGLTVCSSAFSGIDLLHLKRSVELLGAKYSEDMTSQCSVLVTKSQLGLRKDKYEHAMEWKIPIVGAEWLWECIKMGSRVEPKPHCYRSQKRSKSLTAGGVLPVNEEKRQDQANNLPTAQTSRADSVQPKEAARQSSPPPNEVTKQPSPPKEAAPKEASKPSSPALNTSASFVTANEEGPHESRAPEWFTVGREIRASDATSFDPSCRTEPLSERDPNSPTKTVSTAPAPSGHPHSKSSEEDISNDISDLLAKTKRAVQPSNEAPEGRKRTTKRIFGRVTSNISTISAQSRSGSVDSTHTPVEKSLSGDDPLVLLLGPGGKEDKDVDSQPPATQLQYDDLESVDVREGILAQMTGRQPPPKRAGMKERSVTLAMGDLGTRRATRQTRMR